MKSENPKSQLREQFLPSNRGQRLLVFCCQGSSCVGVGHDSVDSSWEGLLNLLV
jgi:hypothetical protein